MLIAVIREEDCIGCAKCLPACPVDAIIGAPKFLHSVIADECIGCKLCLAPCPMNCIEMIQSSIPFNEQDNKAAKATKAKERYLARQKRLLQKQRPLLIDNNNPELKAKIRGEINSAIARVKAKRNAQKKNT